MTSVSLFAILGQHGDEAGENGSCRAGAWGGQVSRVCSVQVITSDQRPFFPLAGGGAILLSSSHGGSDYGDETDTGRAF